LEYSMLLFTFENFYIYVNLPYFYHFLPSSLVQPWLQALARKWNLGS